MNDKWRRFLFRFFFLMAVTGWLVLLIEQHSFQEKLKRLEDKRQALQEKVRGLEEAVLRLQIESKVSRLRRLVFLKEPVYRSVNRRELQAQMAQELKKEFGENGLEVTRKVLLKFGFLEPDYDLEKGILALYGEQIGAFYDMEKKALFRVEGLPLGQGFEKALLAHELVHVLQDQHFYIKESLDKVSENDDETLAVQALVEGDATFTMQLYYVQAFNFSSFWDLVTYFFVDQSKLNQAPMVLRENMLFPYTQGLEFVTELYRRGGWSKINEAFHRPPASSEEILHPEKYLSGGDPPKPVVIPSLKEILSGYELIEENALGELNLQLLLKKFLGKEASSKISDGWGGDAYELWEGKNKEALVLVWLSDWDTPDDAAQFFKAYERLIRKKFPSARLEHSDPLVRRWQSDGQWIFLGREESQVLMIESGAKELIHQIRISFEAFKNKIYNG